MFFNWNTEILDRNLLGGCIQVCSLNAHLYENFTAYELEFIVLKYNEKCKECVL